MKIPVVVVVAASHVPIFYRNFILRVAEIFAPLRLQFQRHYSTGSHTFWTDWDRNLRMILHIDMDAFYASVEIRDRPDLAELPVVVGGSPQGRGVVCAANYVARKSGVHSAMPASQVIRVCPNVVFIKPRMTHYAAVSRQIRSIFYRYTSLVEPLSLDEAFLDVGGSEKLFGDGVTIAKAVKAAIVEELGLPSSAGVAPNKFLAKVASDLDKPNGLVVVPVNGVDQFLEPLSVSRVWGVGPKTESRLAALGVQTVGQLKTVSRDELKRAFGANSEHFWRLARGLDTRPVVPDRNAKSISHENTFATDINDPDALRAWLLELVDQVGRRLRRHDLVGRTVKLKLRYSDFRTVTRSRVLAKPDSTTETLWQQARVLLDELLVSSREPVRLLGMGVSQLSAAAKVQGMLFEQDVAVRDRRLDEAADSIRERFGGAAVKRGSSVAHSIRLSSRTTHGPAGPDST